MLSEQYKHGFGVAQMVLMANLKDVSQADSLAVAGNAGNCMNWIAGHLLSSRSAVLGALGEHTAFLQAEEAQPYLQGSAPPSQSNPGQPLERLLTGLHESHAKVMARLSLMEDADFEQQIDPAMFPMPVEQPTLATLMTTLLFHEAYHVGQLGLARRALGMPSGLQI